MAGLTEVIDGARWSGSHVVTLARPGSLPPGLYLLRLTRHSAQLVARAAVTRPSSRARFTVLGFGCDGVKVLDMALPTSRVRATLMEDRPQAGVRGFLESARTWAADLVGTSRSRLDHFTSDVEERLFRLLARLMWTFVAFVCLSLGLLLAMLTVVFGFDLPPRYALGIPAVMLLLVGLVAVGVMRRKRGSKPARSEKHRRR